MQTIHKPPNLPQHMMPVGAPSPAADGQGGQPPNRMMQGKPMGMMPPPSPAMSAKTPGGPSKQEDSGLPNGRIDASPQNIATGIGGPGPGPGIPSATTTPAPPTPNASGTGMTAPSPSAILASTPTMSNHPPPPPPPGPGPNPSEFDASSFSLNFSELGDLDASTFMGDTSLNFERDFAAWFDPENANGP